MGWYVGQGPEAMGRYYPAARFHTALYRPDVIQKVLANRNVGQAVAAADKARGQASEPPDLKRALANPVTIVAPEQSRVRLPGTTLKVKATARSAAGPHAVTHLRLLVDGKPYAGEGATHRIAEPRAGTVSGEWSVELPPGPHRLQVAAYSSAGWQYSDEREVLAAKPAAAASTLPNLYVASIGINDYANTSKLNYCAQDARAIEQVFRQKSRPLFSRVTTRVLTDRQATRERILALLNSLRRVMTARDVAVIFFSGHGGNHQPGGFFLVPVDYDSKQGLRSAVSAADLKKVLAELPGRVLLLLDCCYAGAIGLAPQGWNISPMGNLMRDLLRDDYGVVVMCSSMAREQSWENSAVPHSNFTKAVLEGLSGQADYNRDGLIHLNELDLYVSERIKSLSQNRQNAVTGKPTSMRSFALTRL
jgi:hypothetical protein